MKVEIDVRKWYRGQTSLDSYLERGRDGRRCCLGFLGRALGLQDEDLVGIKMPFVGEGSPWPTELAHDTFSTSRGSRSVALSLALINDAPLIDDATRRAWIEEGFRHLTAPDGTKCNAVWVGE